MKVWLIFFLFVNWIFYDKERKWFFLLVIKRFIIFVLKVMLYFFGIMKKNIFFKKDVNVKN